MRASDDTVYKAGSTSHSVLPNIKAGDDSSALHVLMLPALKPFAPYKVSKFRG